MKKGSVSSSTW